MMGCEGLISRTFRPFMYSAALASAIACTQNLVKYFHTLPQVILSNTEMFEESTMWGNSHTFWEGASFERSGIKEESKKFTWAFIRRSWAALQPNLEVTKAQGLFDNLLLTATFSTLLPSFSLMKSVRPFRAVAASSACKRVWLWKNGHCQADYRQEM